MINYTISSPYGNINLYLSDKQYYLLDFRLKREFMILTREEKIINQINAAKSTDELETLMEKRSICDVSNFSDINLDGLKMALKVIVRSLYRFPKLRSRLCYIGTHKAYANDIRLLMSGDVSIMKDFGLHYLCDGDITRDLGGLVYRMAEDTLRDSASYVATAINACGFFDAILLDHNDYNSDVYKTLMKEVKYNSISGFHPQGCTGPDSIIYHEIGHLIDDLCGITSSIEFAMLYRRLSHNDILTGLSEYAATSPQEFVAEAFAEYMCSPTPRRISVDIYSLIQSKYKALK